MNSPGAALIILNYHDVDRSLSVAEVGIKTGLFQKVFLVDNASDDASIAKIREFEERYPSAFCPVLSPINLGWCAGTNLGLKQALSTNAYQYLFAVNSDVAFLKESVFECLDFLENNPPLWRRSSIDER
jgi:GT2 family glycosyltransferase